MCPGQLSKESLENLNGQHTNRESFLNSNMERDNIFVVEGIFLPKITFVKKLLTRYSEQKSGKREYFLPSKVGKL